MRPDYLNAPIWNPQETTNQQQKTVCEASVRYRADITAGALKLNESRVIADLLLQDVDEAGWRKAIYDQNVLQTRSPKTAKRLRTLIRGRLETMTDALWRLVRDGTTDVATHACLAAAVKHSHLLGDFLDLIATLLGRVMALRRTGARQCQPKDAPGCGARR